MVAFAWLGDNACAERGPRLGVVSSDVSGGLSDVVFGEPLERLAVWGARGVTCMAPSSVQENKNKNGSGASQHHLPTYYLPTYLPTYLSMISAFAVRDGPPLATILLRSCVRPFGALNS